MDIEVLYRPVNSLTRVTLEEGESIQAEPGAMVGMSSSIVMETTTDTGSKDGGGGMLGKLAGAAKRALSGESFFKNVFRAEQAPGEVLLAQALSGDIVQIEVPRQGLKLQSSAYIANTPGIEVDGEMGGATTLFGGEGLFQLDVQARKPGGRVVVGAFGGIEEREIDGSLVVDSGHMVAWEPSLQLSTERAGGGILASLLSGEGRVFRITGQGRAWFQTRHPDEFGNRIGPQLPPK